MSRWLEGMGILVVAGLLANLIILDLAVIHLRRQPPPTTIGQIVRPSAEQELQAFERAARRIVNAIASEDLETVAQQAALDNCEGESPKNVISVVRRTVNWERSNDLLLRKPLQEPATPGKQTGDETYLWLGGLTPFVWEEEKIDFDESELRGKEFRGVLKQFGSFVRQTWQAYISEGYSLNMVDHWRSRRMGPAVEGKLASNAFWYVGLVQQCGEWRVHRLEYAIY